MSICIAAVIHCLCHVEFYASHLKQVTLYELSHISLGDTEGDNDAAASGNEGANTKEDEKNELNSRQAEAAQKLRDLLEEDRIYMDENLTSSTVADMLGISRSSLSSLVMSTYGIPFREMLNNYRIESSLHEQLQPDVE